MQKILVSIKDSIDELRIEALYLFNQTTEYILKLQFITMEDSNHEWIRNREEE